MWLPWQVGHVASKEWWWSVVPQFPYGFSRTFTLSYWLGFLPFQFHFFQMGFFQHNLKASPCEPALDAFFRNSYCDTCHASTWILGSWSSPYQYSNYLHRPVNVQSSPLKILHPPQTLLDATTSYVLHELAFSFGLPFILTKLMHSSFTTIPSLPLRLRILIILNTVQIVIKYLLEN